MRWNLLCIIKLPYLFPIYTIWLSGTLYVMILQTCICTATSYWTKMMANNGHYMLNEYDNLHIGQKQENKQKSKRPHYLQQT